MSIEIFNYLLTYYKNNTIIKSIKTTESGCLLWMNNWYRGDKDDKGYRTILYRKILQRI